MSWNGRTRRVCAWLRGSRFDGLRDRADRRGGHHVWRELGRQLAHPLALLLWAAAGLSWLAGTVPAAAAILIVIALNAVFAFAQELQAEPTVEALQAYLLR